MRVANRIFTERSLSQVEVIVSLLYWHVFRRWRHLGQENGTAFADSPVDESIVVEEAGERISYVEAYHHRGEVLRGMCLYDYVSLVKLRRNDEDDAAASWGEVPFESAWALGRGWLQVLRRPPASALMAT
ncbi:hypothetical protein BKA56DRAFT_602817 [Ilyonectria sp. MPI-CAGE-AT-0026]|nr:hypothetical protein BKA56DRAFT_602817 [Ilyonectria sp. MPI-CAGE-AT-0026]